MSRSRSFLLLILTMTVVLPAYGQVGCPAPPIVTQPQSQTILSGQSATLSVSISATPGSPYSYQWFQGVSGDTSTPISLTPSTTALSDSIIVSPTITTNYWVQITDSCRNPNVVNSQTATVTVCTPPTITLQPQDTTVTSGQSATLTVRASGSAPLTYQWYQGTAPDTSTPVGSNSSTFTTGPLTSTTSYWVRVTNSCGTVDSTTATAFVCNPPLITSQPQSTTVMSGQSATFTVGVSGSAPFTYQWYQGTAPDTSTPVGTNSNTFNTGPLTSTRSYWVRVTNSCGTVNSTTATATVCNPPVITSQPQSTTVTSGQSATFTVGASGSAPLTYQWYQGVAPDTSTPVGTNSNTFSTGPLTSTRSYWVRVTNPCGAVNSTTVTATVCNPPVITQQPQSTTVPTGQSATFTVAASGSAPLTYQWYQGVAPDTSTPVGTNSNTFSTGPLTSTRSYWVRVTNSCGIANSGTVTATVCNPPIIVTQPQPQSAFLGDPVILTVTASGDAPLTYQWFRGASGDTSAPVSAPLDSPSFTTPALTQNSSFFVRVSNPCGFVDSGSVNVFVFAQCLAPAITTQPSSLVVNPGANASFTVAATGSGALNYQWFVGESGDTSTPVGTNAPSLTLTAVQVPTKVWVRISNQCGSINSNSATVTLNCVPLAAPVPSVVAETLSGVPYDVTWTAVPAALTYEVQESGTADFAAATTLVTSSTSLSFGHLTGAVPTAFYYRVRAGANCPQSTGPYSEAVRIVVQPNRDLRPVKPTGISFAIPAGSKATPTYTFLYVPAVQYAGVAFRASADVPWITVSPASGIALPGGIEFTITVDASALPPGTNFGTVNLVFGSDKREVVENHNTVAIPVAVSAVTPVSPVPRSTPQENSLIFPAVAHLTGIGADFVSDLRVTNTAAQTVGYTLIFTPSGSEAPGNLKQTRVTIEPGRTMALNDVVKQWFGFGSLNDGAKGMVEVRPENYAGKVSVDLRTPFTTVASSRTYATTQSGTFGQFVPAIPFSRFINASLGAANARISLQQIAQSSTFRTNLGLVEASGQPVVVRVSVFSNNGQRVGEFTENLRGGEHKQIDQYLATKGLQLADGRIEVAVVSGAGRVSAYASVIDNRSSDPMLVAPARLFEESASRRVIAGVAEISTGTARWRSDVRIFNPQANTIVPLTLRLYPQGGGAAVTRQISVAAGEVLALDNVVQSVFGVSGVTGALHVETASDSPLVVTARTYDMQATGTYGQFIPAVVGTDGVALNERPLNVLQLEQSSPYRTNLGLAEVSGQAATVELNLILPTTAAAAVRRVTLAPNEFLQLNSVLALMGAPTGYNGRITVRVVAGSGRVFAYASNIDNLTQDPTYIPGQ